MYINTFKYHPSDVSCQLCTEYVKKQGCTASLCPWLKERIEAGVVGYREAVFETMPRDRALHSVSRSPAPVCQEPDKKFYKKIDLTMSGLRHLRGRFSYWVIQTSLLPCR